jgi:enoyl-CoA hydratase
LKQQISHLLHIRNISCICCGMTADSVVLTERRGPVLVITLNRPEARNAVDAALAHGLGRALDELDADDALAVGVLTGAGQAFSSGMDLKAFVSGERPTYGDRGFAGIVERPPVTPLIAAVEGFALGGGCEIALACDLIVAAHDARFGIPEVKRSLVAAGGALLRLPRRVPSAIAMELALTGEPIGAERAHAVGLVNALAEPGSALDVALALADRIAANGPLALSATKRILSENWPEAEFWARQREIARPVFASEDAREAARAFAEKRAPVWSGR